MAYSSNQLLPERDARCSLAILAPNLNGNHPLRSLNSQSPNETDGEMLSSSSRLAVKEVDCKLNADLFAINQSAGETGTRAPATLPSAEFGFRLMPPNERRDEMRIFAASRA